MNALSCVGCAGPSAVAHRPLRGLGAMSGDTVIGAVVASILLIGVFALTAPKNKSILKGIFGAPKSPWRPKKKRKVRR